MQTPAERCRRIVTALEDLVAQESAALANRDFNTVLTLQERTAPLVDFIVTTGAAYVAQPDLRARLDALQMRRGQTSELLLAEMQRNRFDLQETRAAQRRVAQIAPAYGQSPVSRRKLQAVG
jgi:hypothetical protein